MARQDTDIGYLDFGGNEQLIASKIEDPPAYRGAAPAGSALLKLSANRLRSDGGQNEKCLVIFKVDDEAPGDGGCFDFFLQRPNTEDDANMIRVLRITTRGAVFHVPVSVSDGTQPPPPNPPPTTDPTHGIPAGDVSAIRAVYGFACDEPELYPSRKTWAQIIERMDVRDDFRHFPRS